MKLRVFSYAGCGTCRKALAYLRERSITHEVLPIREQPPNVAELRAMLRHLAFDMRRLFNSSGQEYRRLDLTNRLRQLSETEVLELLASNGRLVKRPFALSASSGAVGFKPAEWERFAQ